MITIRFRLALAALLIASALGFGTFPADPSTGSAPSPHQGDHGDHGGNGVNAAPVMGCYGGQACQDADPPRSHGCYDCATTAEVCAEKGVTGALTDLTESDNIGMCVNDPGSGSPAAAAPVMGCYGGQACQDAGMSHGCYDCATTAEVCAEKGVTGALTDLTESDNIGMCVN